MSTHNMVLWRSKKDFIWCCAWSLDCAIDSISSDKKWCFKNDQFNMSYDNLKILIG